MLAIALLLATQCQSQAADPEPKRVLMLHSFGPRFKPWSDYEQSLGDKPTLAEAGGFSRPIAGECPLEDENAGYLRVSRALHQSAS